MIARSRKRPRVASFSFRTLGWLVKIEAQLWVRFPTYAALYRSHARRSLLDEPSATRAYRTERALAASPHRRYVP